MNKFHLCTTTLMGHCTNRKRIIISLHPIEEANPIPQKSEQLRASLISFVAKHPPLSRLIHRVPRLFVMKRTRSRVLGATRKRQLSERCNRLVTINNETTRGASPLDSRSYFTITCQRKRAYRTREFLNRSTVFRGVVAQPRIVEVHTVHGRSGAQLRLFDRRVR